MATMQEHMIKISGAKDIQIAMLAAQNDALVAENRKLEALVRELKTTSDPAKPVKRAKASNPTNKPQV